MNCEINWIELGLSTVVSFFLGYFVSIWSSSNYEKKKAKRERDNLETKFKDLVGLFERHDQNNSKIADAILEYSGGNSFIITVTTYLDSNGNKLSKEEIQQWVGQVWMEGVRHGHLIFHYTKPRSIAEMHHKRIIISPDKSIIKLFGEGGYGVETFSRTSNEF